MEFTKTALIFDLSGHGAQRDVDGGIEFHRLGRDVVEELLDALATDSLLATGYGTASSWGATEAAGASEAAKVTGATAAARAGGKAV